MNKEVKFSREEMVIVSVWYHEKNYTNLTFWDLRVHFLKRFNKDPPALTTVLKWEKRLFTFSTLFKKGRNISTRLINRLVYVPYILDSMKLYPDLCLKKRAGMVGIRKSKLYDIMRHDIKEYLEMKKKNSGNNCTNNILENCKPITE